MVVGLSLRDCVAHSHDYALGFRLPPGSVVLTKLDEGAAVVLQSVSQ